MVILALAVASVLLRDLLVEAFLGVLLVVVAVEVSWVRVVVGAPEKRIRLVDDEPGQGAAGKVILYPEEESLRRLLMVKRVGGRVDLESTLNFQEIRPESVAGRAKTTPIELRFSTPYAGEYIGRRMKVTITGPLGICTSEAFIPFVQEYVVYPRTLQVAMATLKLLGRGELGETPIDMPGIGTEFYEMRGYQPGDDYRGVNWKASARRGEMVVTEHMREVGGSYLLVLDTRAQGFSDTDRLASTFLSLANGLASSGVRFGVLVHDGEKLAVMSTGESPRESLEIALRTALYNTRLQSSPEILELMPQSTSRGQATGDNQDTILSQLSWLRNEQLKGMIRDVNPWAAALRYINEETTRNVLWVSELLAGVEPLIELAWEARHLHDVEFAVANPCFRAEAAVVEGSRGGMRRERLQQVLSSVGVRLHYGEPLTVAQRVLSA